MGQLMQTIAKSMCAVLVAAGFVFSTTSAEAGWRDIADKYRNKYSKKYEDKHSKSKSSKSSTKSTKASSKKAKSATKAKSASKTAAAKSSKSSVSSSDKATGKKYVDKHVPSNWRDKVRNYVGD